MIVQVQRENLTKQHRLVATPVNLQRFDVTKWVELSSSKKKMGGFDSVSWESLNKTSLPNNHYQEHQNNLRVKAYSSFATRTSYSDQKNNKLTGTKEIQTNKFGIRPSFNSAEDYESKFNNGDPHFDRSSSLRNKLASPNRDLDESQWQEINQSAYSTAVHKSVESEQNITVGKIDELVRTISRETPFGCVYSGPSTSQNYGNNVSQHERNTKRCFFPSRETANIRISEPQKRFFMKKSSRSDSFQYANRNIESSNTIPVPNIVSQTENYRENRFDSVLASKCTYRSKNITDSCSTEQTQPSSSSLSYKTQFETDKHSSMKGKRRSSKKSKNPPREWKTAVDPKTGRTYYYDVHTRETQWSKPIELASQEEQNSIREKDIKQREFFANMEANILKCLQTGQIPGNYKGKTEDELKLLPSQSRQQSLAKPKPISVRTISKMDHELLDELTKVPADLDSSRGQVKSAFGSQNKFEQDAINKIKSATFEMTQASNPPAHSSMPKSSEKIEITKLQSSQSANIPFVEISSKPSKNLAKPRLMKRNTCGTMYVGSTMSAPDIDATIKCICGLYRAHLLRSTKEESTSDPLTKFPEYEIFNDHISDRKEVGLTQSDDDKQLSSSSMPLHGTSFLGASNSSSSLDIQSGVENLDFDYGESVVPSLDEITFFFRDVLHRSQLENDCMIMSLIYVERLMLMTKGGLSPRRNNWRSLLFSCMVLASKVWDDLSMWNGDFSQTCPAGVTFSLQRINELELAVLSCLKYNVKVLASEYAKYYFLLRSMLIRSGLASSDVSSSIPLDSEGAKKFEFLSANFQAIAAKKKISSATKMQRSKSAEAQVSSPDRPNAFSPRVKKLNLEQVVKM